MDSGPSELRVGPQAWIPKADMGLGMTVRVGCLLEEAGEAVSSLCTVLEHSPRACTTALLQPSAAFAPCTLL